MGLESKTNKQTNANILIFFNFGFNNRFYGLTKKQPDIRKFSLSFVENFDFPIIDAAFKDWSVFEP